MLKVRRSVIVLFFLCIAACSQSKAPPSVETRQAFDHLAKAVALNNQATRLVNRGPVFSHMPTSEFTDVQTLWRAALFQARKINPAHLDAEEPGFGDIFKNKFIRGLELCTEASEASALIEGQLLLNEFGEALAVVKSKSR